MDRALAIARSEPQGPVYLTLPREVLSERHDAIEYFDPPRAGAAGRVVAGPGTTSSAAAAMLAAARNPIVITKSVRPRSATRWRRWCALAEALGAPVFDQFGTHLNFPQDHPLLRRLRRRARTWPRPTRSWSSRRTRRGSPR